MLCVHMVPPELSLGLCPVVVPLFALLGTLWLKGHVYVADKRLPVLQWDGLRTCAGQNLTSPE